MDPAPLLVNEAGPGHVGGHEGSKRSMRSPQSRRSSFSVSVTGDPDDEIQHMTTSKYLGALPASYSHARVATSAPMPHCVLSYRLCCSHPPCSIPGGKTITFFGSIVLTVNNVSGPGMLALPVVYQQGVWCRVQEVAHTGGGTLTQNVNSVANAAGALIPSLAFIFVCILASLSGSWAMGVVEVLWRTPGCGC